MKSGQRVQLTKMETVNGDGTRYQPGYTAWGHLFWNVEIGSSIFLMRYRRSRQTPDEPEFVNCTGEFMSSRVESIDGDLVKTTNSVWRITVLPPLSTP